MFCQNCGKQIPDGSKFCRYCGATQTADGGAEAAQQPRPAQQPARSGRKRKKKRGIGPIVTVLVILAAALVGRYMVAPMLLSDGGDAAAPEPQNPLGIDVDNLLHLNPPTGDISQAAQPDAQAVQPAAQDEPSGTGSEEMRVNPEFVALFEDNYASGFTYTIGDRIARLSLLQSRDSGEDAGYACYARKIDGGILCRAYAATDDVLFAYIEAYYFDITGCSEEDRQNLENFGAQEVAHAQPTPCCEVKYGFPSDELFIIQYECTGLDLEENYAALRDVGLTDVTGPYSMAAMQQADVDAGGIRYAE